MLWNAKNGKVDLETTTMSYVCFGHGKKHLILLPGLSDGLMTVDGKALLLAKPYTLFFDQYTVFMFSRKEPMPDGYTIRDMASDQAKVLKKMGLNKVYVLGVSQGGMIAQYLAADHPELVKSMVLAVTAPSCNDIIRKNITHWISLAEASDHKSLMIDNATKSLSPVYLKKYQKLYPVIGWIGKPKSYDRFIKNAKAILHFDAIEEIQNISCPVLIIGGHDDQIVGIEASYEIKKQIKNSQLYIYQGLGHGAYEEAPDFNQKVFHFFEKCDM